MKKFEDLIWHTYKNEDNFERLAYQLREVRSHMLKHKAFALLPIKEQFAQCVTIGCMLAHTAHGDLNALSILRRSKGRGDLKYDVLKGFKEPERIEIGNSRLLLLTETAKP